MTYVDHGRRHLPGGTDPIPGLTSGGTSFYPSPFQPVPLFALQTSQFGSPLDDNSGFNGWKIDTSAPGGRLFTNTLDAGLSPRTSALGDYFTFPVLFGPKGSAWALCMSWKQQPSGGTFKVTIATTTDTNGELEDPTSVSASFLSPIDLNSGFSFEEETYQGGTPNYRGVSSTYSQVFVIGGDDGAIFTSVTGTDPDLLVGVIDGGAGMYRWKLEVTGKNASSTGYDIDLLAATWVRLTALATI